MYVVISIYNLPYNSTVNISYSDPVVTGSAMSVVQTQIFTEATLLFALPI